MKNLKNRGFSFIELLIVITILVLIGALTMPNLTNFRKEQSLKNTSENIVALLNKAKSNSISSLNSSNYGVHFESDHMIYFMGESYIEDDPNNQRVNFENGVTLATENGINLDGGGDDIIFPRLTRDVIGYGTIIIQITTEPEIQKTITISKTGSVESE